MLKGKVVVVKDLSMLEVVPDKADFDQETTPSTYQRGRHTDPSRPRHQPWGF